MTDRQTVLLFLHLMKMAAHERFVFVNREKNLRALSSLGITRAHAEALVLALQPEHYVSGPSLDHNDPGREMWVFGVRTVGTEVYVKLQVIAEPPARCVCVSFHESERPMAYPLGASESSAIDEES